MTKDNTIKTILGILFTASIVVAIILVLTHAPQADSKQSELKDKYIQKTDDVTTDMLTPDFWANKYEASDVIIMNQDEILEWNAKAEKEASGLTEDINFYNAQQMNYASDEAIKNALTSLAYIGEDPLYDEDGNELPIEHWNAAYKNMNLVRLKRQNEIRFGIVTQYSEMRRFPTSERAYQNIDNQLFDDFVNSAALVNEKVVVLRESRDHKWFFVFSNNAGGWIEADHLALCKSQEEWNAADDGDFLLITAERFLLPIEVGQPETSRLELSMGVKLPLLDPKQFDDTIGQRTAQDNYIVKIPVRDADGYLEYKAAYVPAGEDVHIGYLDYTSRNILNQAFKALGARYGWGGMLLARDCSSYTCDIYKCFGIRFERNSSAQASMPGETLELAELTPDDKVKELSMHAVPGSILYFKGHVFLYLGIVDGEAYSISCSSSTRFFDPEGDKYYVQSVMVNPLSIRRPNRNTWLEDLDKNIYIK